MVTGGKLGGLLDVCVQLFHRDKLPDHVHVLYSGWGFVGVEHDRV